MFVAINGPLGAGKSSLAEALVERIPASVYLDGDSLLAGNPPPKNSTTFLHSNVALLVSQFHSVEYKHFVLSHYWETPSDIDHLRMELRHNCGIADFRCFLATLPLDENIERIRLRQSSRAIDELEFELQTVVKERKVLGGFANGELGKPFDLSGPLEDSVEELLRLLLDEGDSDACA